MNIGIVINTSWNIYHFRKEIIESLIENGDSVIAIAPRDQFSKKLEEIGCKYVEVSMDNHGVNPLKDYFLFRNLKKI